jgi:hypothetical protein
MDGVEMKRGKGHKRKALDAGIQNQKAESAAPGSAEVRDETGSFFFHLGWCLLFFKKKTCDGSRFVWSLCCWSS